MNRREVLAAAIGAALAPAELIREAARPIFLDLETVAVGDLAPLLNPPGTYEEFQATMLRQIARSMAIPYSVLAAEYAELEQSRQGTVPAPSSINCHQNPVSIGGSVAVRVEGEISLGV